MGFREDLRVGQMYEDKFEKLMVEKFGALVEKASTTKACPFDYAFERGIVEVKADRMVSKTGNFFIEFECNKRASGISVTKATYYLLIDVAKDIPYLVETKTLIAIANDTNCRIVSGCENGKNKGFLVEQYKLNRFKII
jgi:hypothetical protein